jgi:hypothetical protein
MAGFVDIDYRRRRRVPAWFFPGLAVAAVALAWGGQRYTAAERAVEAARAQQSQLLRQQAAHASANRPVEAPAVPKERAKAVNQAIAALNTPWPELLGALETSRPAKVTLMRIEPRPKDTLVLVTAQADDMPALLGFMASLAQAEPFVSVRPVRQEALAEGGGPRMQATFEAHWETRP